MEPIILNTEQELENLIKSCEPVDLPYYLGNMEDPTKAYQEHLKAGQCHMSMTVSDGVFRVVTKDGCFKFVAKTPEAGSALYDYLWDRYGKQGESLSTFESFDPERDSLSTGGGLGGFALFEKITNLPDRFREDLFFLVKEGAIICGSTALYLVGKLDRLPNDIDVIAPAELLEKLDGTILENYNYKKSVSPLLIDGAPIFMQDLFPIAQSNDSEEGFIEAVRYKLGKVELSKDSQSKLRNLYSYIKEGAVEENIKFKYKGSKIAASGTNVCVFEANGTPSFIRMNFMGKELLVENIEEVEKYRARFGKKELGTNESVLLGMFFNPTTHSRSIGRAKKRGFYISNLSNGDILSTPNGKITVTSVGADDFYAKDSQGKEKLYTSLSGMKLVSTREGSPLLEKRSADVEKIARDFSELLQKEIGKHNLKKVVDLNRAEEDPKICHSHDFCDANMVMGKAMQKNGYKEFLDKPLEDQVTQEELKVWNEAWETAKKNEFYIADPIKEGHSETSEESWFNLLNQVGFDEMKNLASSAFSEISGSSKIADAKNETDLWNTLDYLNLFDEFISIAGRKYNLGESGVPVIGQLGTDGMGCPAGVPGQDGNQDRS